VSQRKSEAKPLTAQRQRAEALLQSFGIGSRYSITYAEAVNAMQLFARSEARASDDLAAELYVQKKRVADLEGDFVADVKALVTMLEEGGILTNELARVRSHLSAYPESDAMSQPVAVDDRRDRRKFSLRSSPATSR
jgi:hypothetical protein